MKALWPHQQKALAETLEHQATGKNNICVVMPTGAGKTSLGAAWCVEMLSRMKPDEGSLLWCAHREELVSQAFDDLTEWGLECGVIQAKPSRIVNPHRPVQIASTQTLIARGILPQAHFRVFDEFHHYASDKWSELIKANNVPTLGLTATPIRSDGRSLEGLMDVIVQPVSVKELMADGRLCSFEMVGPGRKLDSDQIIQNPLKAYQEHAAGRKAIGFAANVKTAKLYTAEFNAAGVKSAVVWSTMPGGERKRTLDAYRDGDIRVLWNVGVLTEGFDDRDTSCIIVARSVGSISLWIQMWGRGLRIFPGKENCVCIDLHGTVYDVEFGPPDLEREWTLEGDGIVHKDLVKPPEKFCPTCGTFLGLGEGAAPCDSPLCSLVRGEEAGPPEILGGKLVKYAAKIREPEAVRKKYFDKLKGIAHSKGWSPWQPHMKYKALYGEKPPKEWW